MNKLTSPTPGLIYLLAAMTGTIPLAVDAYLPAMPDMAVFFQTTIHDIEFSLSIFLCGLALGQLIGGPFSDHYGRRAATGCGITLFCLGTLGILISETIEMVWLFRFIEAFGGGLAVVNSAAVIRDLSHGNESARHLSNMAVIMMMAPLFAPLIGMVLLHIEGWRLIFLFLLAFGLIIGTTTFFKLPETRQHQADRPSAFKRYWMVFTHRPALSFIIAQCFALGGMFAFITGSPAVYMNYFGVSETLYPFLFGANVLGMIIANRINLRLLHHYAPHSILWSGQILQILIGLVLLAYVSLSQNPSLLIFMPLIILFIGAMGLMVSNATSCTVEFFPHNAATATALLGAAGFAMGSLSGALMGTFGDGSPFAMTITMLSCAILGLSLRFLLQR